MPSAARKKSTKSQWKEFRIELQGKRRDDGSLFVTSKNLGPFSAVLENGNWEAVLPLLKKFLQINFGPVKDMRLIHDASELMPSEEGLPPAYIIAELNQDRARAM